MKKSSRRMALCGMMAALGTAIMMTGGLIPIAVFCSPAVAGLVLLPVFNEYGEKWALGVYGVIGVLSILLSPDKESALLFVFLGYYPVIKARVDTVRPVSLRTVLKPVIFNAAIGLMLLTVTYLLGMQDLLNDYLEMTRIALVVFVLVANVTFLVYDVLLALILGIYRARLRPRLFRSQL